MNTVTSKRVLAVIVILLVLVALFICGGYFIFKWTKFWFFFGIAIAIMAIAILVFYKPQLIE